MPEPAPTDVAWPVVVMGVSGSGKTTIARRLADRLDVRFVDGDDLHPAENVVKMAAGTALDDEDRRPWLAAVHRVLADGPPSVIACSALKRSYRDVLRDGVEVRFVLLDLDEATATERVAGRDGHFMGSDMVASQFATLERPAGDEHDVVLVDATQPIAVVVDDALALLVRSR